MVSNDEKKIRLYKALLEKYSDIINDKNKKTVGEIKALVDKTDLTIQSVLQSIQPENFSFNANYLEGARKAFEFVKTEIDHVESNLSINYWFTPSEVLAYKIADDEDSAVFLCSLLFALGDEKAYVVISELSDLSTHAFVVTEFKGKFYLFDSSSNQNFNDFSGKMEDILRIYSYNGLKIKRFLYKFNSEMFESFEKSEEE